MHWMITGNYVLLDIGHFARGTGSLLDDDIKAYIKDEMHYAILAHWYSEQGPGSSTYNFTRWQCIIGGETKQHNIGFNLVTC